MYPNTYVLWKAVQIASCESRAAVTPRVEPYRACSACSGDYEDPERTAPRDSEKEEADGEEGAGDVQRSVDSEEFPVREG